MKNPSNDTIKIGKVDVWEVTKTEASVSYDVPVRYSTSVKSDYRKDALDKLCGEAGIIFSTIEFLCEQILHADAVKAEFVAEYIISLTAYGSGLLEVIGSVHDEREAR